MHFIKRFGGELARLVAFAVIFGAVTSSATLYKWSQTAATNSTADATINWAEGMAPSAVNDSARAMMAAVAKYRDDTNGTLVTAGTSTAITITTNQAFASLTAMHGQTIRVQMSATSGASPTLNVDGLGAKNIVSVLGTAIPAGAMVAHGVYDLSYNNNTAEWTLAGATFGNEIPSGSKVPFWQAACPTGWTKDSTAALNDAAMVTSTVSGGGTAGTTAFSSVMTSRTISQANLPNVNFTHSGTSVSILNGNVTVGVKSNGPSSGAGAASAVGSVDAATNQVAANSGTISASVDAQGVANSGGSGTALDFNSKYSTFIVCTRN